MSLRGWLLDLAGCVRLLEWGYGGEDAGEARCEGGHGGARVR